MCEPQCISSTKGFGGDDFLGGGELVQIRALVFIAFELAFDTERA